MYQHYFYICIIYILFDDNITIKRKRRDYAAWFTSFRRKSETSRKMSLLIHHNIMRGC